MGWDPARLLDPEFLILSTHGDCARKMGEPSRSAFTPDIGSGLLVAEAARELKAFACNPFAGAWCTDPAGMGAHQGTAGMMDSLPFRNDAAMGVAAD